MFVAKGVSFLNLPSGLCEAKVEYLKEDEQGSTVVAQHTYVVTSKATLMQYVHRQLDALKAEAEDDKLGVALVGEILGTSA